MWLVSTNPAKLKNFLSGGTKVELLKELPDDDAASGGIGTPFEIGADTRASSSNPTAVTSFGPLDALPDAERRIIPSWKTVDRVLDCLIWSKGDKKKGKGKQKRTVVSDDEDVDMEDDLPEGLKETFEKGEEPDSEYTLGPADWERTMGGPLSEEDIDKVVWIFVKWGDLGYDEGKIPWCYLESQSVTDFFFFSVMGFPSSSRGNWIRCLCERFQAIYPFQRRSCS
jgi:hypothetical protein